MPNEIIRMVQGSHLYGTNVEGSDTNYKGVFIPDGRRILLGRVQEVYNTTSQEQDIELFSLAKFLHLAMQGQTVALDMLFTPEKFYVTQPSPEWRAIQTNRERFLSRGVKAFVGYCRQQSKKYAVKIERYQAVENAYRYFNNALYVNNRPSNFKIQDMPYLYDFVANNDYTKMVDITLRNKTVITHLECCETRIPVTQTIKEAYETFERKFKEYGKRVSSTTNTDSKDWKSMYHAVRVANQAIEFLNTGTITFPRPEAEYLLKVRLGKVPYDKVSDQIEQALRRIEDALEMTALPEEPDREFADSLVIEFYKQAVLDQMDGRR